MSKLAHRYAIYYAPPTESPWWQAGSQWLGRCAATGRVQQQPLVPGISSETFAALTAAPRRYGWHATLKAPFSLSEGTTLDQLCAVIENLAGALSSFDMPTLRVQRLDDFLALVPNPGAVHAQEGGRAERSAPTHELAPPAAQAPPLPAQNALPSHLLEGVARVCVQELAPLAAPLTAADLQRRRLSPLTAVQDALLVRWGYPYVMEEFRFHCSLTGSLEGLGPLQEQALQHSAEGIFHGLPPCRFESLALFEEPTPGADFRLVQHFGLRA
jgi:hypothetical protein